MAASSTRQQRAQLTRQRICDAGKQLFLTQGYTATTITDIAASAGVAHQTVYFVFGSKAALLSVIVDSEIVGDLDAVPLLERPQVRRIAQIPDPLRRLQRIVAVTCDITQRVAPLYEIVRSGAADGEVRELLDRHEEQRWHSLHAFAAMLDGDLAAGLELDDAADRLYALLSHEQYWLLVHRRRWRGTRWRQHVTEQAARQLLPESAETGSCPPANHSR
ncbi:MAG: TetR/AcrR family transcriptional regulator [Jatrophihabitantaceae bacterium]